MAKKSKRALASPCPLCGADILAVSTEAMGPIDGARHPYTKPHMGEGCPLESMPTMQSGAWRLETWNALAAAIVPRAAFDALTEAVEDEIPKLEQAPYDLDWRAVDSSRHRLTAALASAKLDVEGSDGG